ncbi:MBL fold metallo-hydrolase [Chitinilyticum piscinae]|uniref:MBL fold metallo-hydrolase n=1 Tax=Chitinilyticum piscinae TaxID=2866724 RepID=A0A8J7FKJ3_9NEIS|nr:MBL fold metallo-hydrolase [Chitinilyticum piscinae]MBE9609417.1 MBL fold metallo-hydrolase [Chitinilyticum piscinae]
MKRSITFFQEGQTRWTVIARDPEKQQFVIDTNEYLIEKDGRALLADPGGSEIFPAVFTALTSACNPANLDYLFASHQDPDIISSLALWLDYKPSLRCYVSRLWSGFIPHFGGDGQTLLAIPDEGMDIQLGSGRLFAMPAHFLHSSGNFHLYDPQSRILFCGDVGAALLPHEQTDIFVTDFDRHIQHAEGFHKRWMGSQEAKLDWCARAANMEIDMLCPQHGAIYQGADVMRFINWFAELPVGLSTFAKAKTC